MLEVKWICGNCGHWNTDDFAATSAPMCDGCGGHFEWDDILWENDGEFNRLNRELKRLQNDSAEDME